MIAYLKGAFAHVAPTHVIIECGGIGYDVHISLYTYADIQHKEQGLLFTHLIIREDAHLLYGFSELKEKEMFLLLLSVSGIGANTARLMLSYMKPEELTHAILTADTKALEGIKGIGKKTAERAVLELKDKIGKQSPNIALPAGTVSVSNPVKQDALEALLALGINKQQAEQNIAKILGVEPAIKLEELIKKVLKGL